MKNYPRLVILLVSFCCSGYGERVGNPDDSAIIDQPCSTLDLNCIRGFFESHSHCERVHGLPPYTWSSFRRDVHSYLPRFNVTFVSTDFRINGTLGRITTFYVNRDTGNLVFAVEFRGVTETYSSYFRFHRRGKEPVITYGTVTATYESLTFTAVIPYEDHLDLKKAECTTFVNDNIIQFPTLSPSIFNSNDPQVQAAEQTLPKELLTEVLELFFTQSSYFIVQYIQNIICDFGLVMP